MQVTQCYKLWTLGPEPSFGQVTQCYKGSNETMADSATFT
jgi:hypothetical protein